MYFHAATRRWPGIAADLASYRLEDEFAALVSPRVADACAPAGSSGSRFATWPMRADARDVAAGVALGATVAAIGFTAFALLRLRAFARREPPRSELRPPITLLKPVHGLEPGLEDNLPHVLHAGLSAVPGRARRARSRPTPALPVLRRIAATCGGRVDGRRRRRRRAPPQPEDRDPRADAARTRAHDLLVIADSDMRVGPDYLDAIAAAFDDPDVGAATCIYRGEPARDNLASLLGAMSITDQFAPSALVATSLEPLTYCFGGTMAVRRAVLDEIGGLDALGSQLADDAALGRLTAARGHRVALAHYVAATLSTNRASPRSSRTSCAGAARSARYGRAAISGCC